MKISDEFVKCPECGVSVKFKNLPDHLSRVHEKSMDSTIPPICPHCGKPMEEIAASDETYEKALALIEKERFGDALELLEKVKEHPLMDEIHALLGVTLYELGEKKESLLHFQKAVELDPKHYVNWYNLGLTLIERGNLAKAIKCFNKVLKLNPDEKMMEDSKKLLEGIRKVIEAELEKKPNLDINTWLELNERFTRGVEHMENDEFDPAIREFAHVASVDEHSEKAHGNLGLIYLLKGEFDKAEEHLNKALDINPTYVPALNNLLRLEEAKRMIGKDPGYLAALKKQLIIKHF